MRSELTDAQLLALLGRDKEALEAFYLRHVGAVTGFLARRCRTPEDLADAVAQTFVEVIGSASRYDTERGQRDGLAPRHRSPHRFGPVAGATTHCRPRRRRLRAAVAGRG